MSKRRCEVCRGTGRLGVGGSWYVTTADCAYCNGTGQIETDARGLAVIPPATDEVSDFCSCGEAKKDPEDQQCQSCRAADEADRAYEMAREREMGAA